MASYISQTISNYNDDAPPDDGTETSDNEITWAIIKDELADPIKNYAEAIDSATSAAFTTVDSEFDDYATGAVTELDGTVFDYNNSSSDSIATGTYTAVPWAGANYATIGYNGMYQINATVTLASVDDGSFASIGIYVDPLGAGSPAQTKLGQLVFNNTGGATAVRVAISTILSLDATDRVYIYVFHNSAAAKSLVSSALVNWFNGYRIIGTSG